MILLFHVSLHFMIISLPNFLSLSLKWMFVSPLSNSVSVLHLFQPSYLCRLLDSYQLKESLTHHNLVYYIKSQYLILISFVISYSTHM